MAIGKKLPNMSGVISLLQRRERPTKKQPIILFLAFYRSFLAITIREPGSAARLQIPLLLWLRWPWPSPGSVSIVKPILKLYR
jgi:hypothetical protein